MQTLGRETGEAAQLETCVSASYAQAASEAIADGNAGPPSCCTANLPLCWPNRGQFGARLTVWTIYTSRIARQCSTQGIRGKIFNKPPRVMPTPQLRGMKRCKSNHAHWDRSERRFE